MKKENKSNKKIYLGLIVAVVVFGILVFKDDSSNTVALQQVENQDNEKTDNEKQPDTNQDPILVEALAYYTDKVDINDTDKVEATKKNFGCHFEIYIYNNGELEMRLSYAGGRFYEL